MSTVFSVPLEQNLGYTAPTSEDIIPTRLATERGVTTENLIDNLIVPPPLVIRTEKIEGEDSSIPGFVSKDMHGEIYKKYVEYQGITNDLIEGFDRMLMYDLPERLSIIFKDLGDGSYIVADRNSLKVLPPTININGVRELFPAEAHDLERTYSGDMYIRFLRKLWSPKNMQKPAIGEDHRIPDPSDQTVDVSEEISIGKIPIMLGSEFCHLSRKRNLSDYDKIRLGSCAYQPNGIFIIKGTDYVVLLEDQTATNKFFIYPKKDIYTSVITTTTNIGSTLIKLSQDKDEVIILSLRFLGSSGKSAKDKKSMNVIRIIRLLLKRILPGYSPTFDYIWKLMEQFINPKALSQTKTLFKKTFLASFRNLEGKNVSAWGNNDDDEFLFSSLEEKRTRQAIGKKFQEEKRRKKKKEPVQQYRYFMTDDEKEAERKQIADERLKKKEEWIEANFIELINDLFPQMPPENLSGKLNMLLLMISRFLEFITGYRKADNQDDWSNKKIINAGPSMLKILVWWYKKQFLTLLPEIPQAAPKVDFTTIDQRMLKLYDIKISDIVSPLKNMESKITESFEHSFTYNWGDQRNIAKPIKKTDILKNANIIDMISHLLRISSQVDDRSTNMAPRMVRYDQYGFVDPADTPEGGTCGLVRNKTLTAIVTVDRDDNVVLAYLKRENKLNTTKTSLNNTVCLLNSKFIGWCNGESTSNYLRGLKRYSFISYDTSIVLDKTGVHILFIHTDGGRLVRPFFVVDDQNKLVMDSKNLWNQGSMSYPEYFDSLLRQGAIEYLSPAEQSMIYAAKSVDFLGQKTRTLESYMNKLKEFKNIEDKIKNENFYILSGQSEIIINSNEKEEADRSEIEKLEQEIIIEKERLVTFENMSTDVFSKIVEIEQEVLDEKEKIDLFESEFKSFKLSVTSHEKLREIMQSDDLNIIIRNYATTLFDRQKELLQNLVRSEINVLEELANGEDESVFNKRHQDIINANIMKLNSSLENERNLVIKKITKLEKEIQQLNDNLVNEQNKDNLEEANKIMNNITRLNALLEIERNNVVNNTNAMKITKLEKEIQQLNDNLVNEQNRGNLEEANKIMNNITRLNALLEAERNNVVNNTNVNISNIIQQIEHEKVRTPKIARKLGYNEMKMRFDNEQDPQLKNILLQKLQERESLIANSKQKIISIYKQIKSLSLDNYILKIKSDVVSFHNQELIRRKSLTSEIRKRIDELQIKLSKVKESSAAFEKLTDKSLKETIVKTESLISRVKKELEFTYCELDPNSMWGVSASVIPLSDRNQSIRNSYVCNQLRQMVGIINTNPNYQMDTTSRATAYPSRPLIEPQLNKVIGVQDMPIGTNVILGIMTYEGKNQEDSLLISDLAVKNGLFRIVKHKVIRIEISPSKTDGDVSIKERIGIPENPKRGKDKYQSLVKGIIELGSVVERGDPLVAITRTITEGGETREEDATHYATIGEEGIVDRITPPFEVAGVTIIKIRLLQVRDIVEGDKLATLSGQKSTIAKIVPVEDMPFGSIYNPKSGKEEMIRPDILMNPHAVPSRMTLELLFEIILGRYAMQAGVRIDATSFKTMNIHDFQNLLPSFGFKSDGTAKLYNGKTGQFMDTDIMIGPTYYALLKHWVLDKIQAHGIRKKIDPQTRQPVKGRSNEGAIRMGAQERDALFSHGAGQVAVERYCISSDRVEAIFCNNCGNLMDLNINAIDYKCKFCKHNDPVRVKIPYGMIKFIRNMGGVGFKVSFSFKKKPIPEIKQ